MNQANQKYEKYLPIGSVVLLKGAKKRLMITGYSVIANDNPRVVYDYSACLYPEGFLSSEQTAVFNHDQIDKIFAIGYFDDEQKQFIQALKEKITKDNQ